MKRSRATSARQRVRFTRRLVIYESPAAVEKLEALADAAGHSVAAEVRYAIRRWFLANEEDR
jgi:ribose 1,5-bisphosphokinase PhnN